MSCERDIPLAGTIGRVLAVSQSQTNGGVAGGGVDAGDYLYFYDANGNVGQLIDYANGVGSATDTEWDAARIVAHYEYDPYGNITDSAGDYAAENPFRFSTKYWDDETGLGYWGRRYLWPQLGRWGSRDPIAERGGMNLFNYCRNAPGRYFDPRGRLPRPYRPRLIGDNCTATSSAAFYVGIRQFNELGDLVAENEGERIMFEKLHKWLDSDGVAYLQQHGVTCTGKCRYCVWAPNPLVPPVMVQPELESKVTRLTESPPFEACVFLRHGGMLRMMRVWGSAAAAP